MQVLVSPSHKSNALALSYQNDKCIFQDYENYVISPNEIRRYGYVTTTELSISRTERIDTTPMSVTDKTLRDLAGTKFDNQTLRTIGKLMRQVKYNET